MLQFVPTKSPYSTPAELRSYLEREFQSIARAMKAAAGPVLNILDYGARGEGEDIAVPFQRAIDDASESGGSVFFPSDRGYKWGMASGVVVSSLFPVNIIADMTANPNGTANASYIKLLDNISGSLIKYESPTASPNAGGGGSIRGLSIMDDSNLADADLEARRVFTLDAALELDAFSLSNVERCYFHYLRGSAIRTGFCVMSNFERLWIRYCGETGLPAFDHPLAVNRAMQSCTIAHLRAEVNFHEPYVRIADNVNCKNSTIECARFEAEDSGSTPDSNQNFIDLAAAQWTIDRPTLNRLDGEYALLISGNGNQVLAPEAELNTGGLAQITGNRNAVLGGHVSAAQATIPTVDSSGEDTKLFGTEFYFANKLLLTGARAKIVGVDMIECDSADYLVDVTGAGSRVDCLHLTNNNAQRPVSPSGVNIAAEGRVTNGRFFGNAATTGINVDSANVHCVDNTTSGYATDVNENGHGTAGANDSIFRDNLVI